MSFYFPLGLLGLIGVPILIIIYIIKNKYTEQTIASTYIWRLSEQFLKRRNPINMLYNWISLILQILMVIVISVGIAHPVFTMPGKANDYLFVLDCSGSMSTEFDEESRLERGKKEIRKLIEASANGSIYSLISVGESAVVVYDQITDSERALDLLDDVEIYSGNSNVGEALTEAQRYFDENPSLKVYFITDNNYTDIENVQIINTTLQENNSALLSVDCSITADGLLVTGKIISYGEDRNLTLSLYIDNNEDKLASVSLSLVGVKNKFDLSKEENEISEDILSLASEYQISCNVLDYQSIKVVIEEQDANALDNEIVLYNVKHDNSFKTLIVSDTPFFIKSALTSLGHRQIDEVTPLIYAQNPSIYKYGLYIFDCYTPDSMPTDGAVWFIAPTTVPDSGFAYQTDSGEHSKYQLEFSSSTSKIAKKLLSDLDRSEDMWVSKYNKYSQARDFTTLLSIGKDPVLFVGSNIYGNREVVFGFDIHDADFSLTYNYLHIFNNLLTYTFPSVVDNSIYTCGDIAKINVLSGCTGINVTAPSGKTSYLNTETSECDYTLEEVGLYKIIVKMSENSSGLDRELYVYSQAPYSESVVNAELQSFIISGEPTDINRDGIYENLIYLFIILAVLFIADWMVYCYEQYQLR